MRYPKHTTQKEFMQDDKYILIEKSIFQDDTLLAYEKGILVTLLTMGGYHTMSQLLGSLGVTEYQFIKAVTKLIESGYKIDFEIPSKDDPC